MCFAWCGEGPAGLVACEIVIIVWLFEAIISSPHIPQWHSAAGQTVSGTGVGYSSRPSWHGN